MNRNIAFVTPMYLPANLYGSDMFVRMMVEEFARRGVDTTVITSNALEPMYWYNPFLLSKKIPASYEVINSVRVYRLPCRQFISSARYLLKRMGLMSLYAGPELGGLARVLLQRRFDVIHSSPFPLYLNRQVQNCVRRLPRKPKHIVTPFFHTHVGEYASRDVGEMLRSADLIHAVTQSEKRDMVRIHATSESKIVVIPLFLDVGHMHDAEALLPDISRFKRAYNIEKKNTVLFAGLKGSMKGAVDVLHAVGEIHKRSKDVVLVAMGHNTSEWEEAKKRMDTSFLVDLGYKKGKEKEVVFASSDVYCMPSRSDSFGLVYLEAWHKKKPVIAARVAAMEELIEEHNGGLLVRFGHRAEIQSAIERLIRDPVLSKTLGNEGHAALMRTYTMKAVYPKYRDLFVHA